MVQTKARKHEVARSIFQRKYILEYADCIPGIHASRLNSIMVFTVFRGTFLLSTEVAQFPVYMKRKALTNFVEIIYACTIIRVRNKKDYTFFVKHVLESLRMLFVEVSVFISELLQTGYKYIDTFFLVATISQEVKRVTTRWFAISYCLPDIHCKQRGLVVSLLIRLLPFDISQFLDMLPSI